MAVQRIITRKDMMVRRLRRLLHQENFKELKTSLKELPPEEIADLLGYLTEEEVQNVFILLPVDRAGVVLNETDDTSEHLLLRHVDDARLANILSRLPDNEAVDILDKLEPERAETILAKVKENEGIRRLMHFPPDSAGGIMSTQYIAVRYNTTVRGALAGIRNLKTDDPDLYHNIYVIDDHGHLLGTIALAKLLKSDPARRLSRLYQGNPVRVQPSVDQEEVARLVSLYNLVSIPVVDESNVLIGVVYVEDVIDVITEEATEDIYKIAGINEPRGTAQSVFSYARIRLPWLLITMLGSMVGAMILGEFSNTLGPLTAVLFTFNPLIAAMSGNVGVQSSSIIIRGLVTGEVSSHNMWRIIFRELQVGLLVGLVCGALVGTVVVLIWKASISIPLLAVTLGVAMCSGMLLAATLGALIPIVLNRLGIDPAIATGPFVTTLNDITGMSTYIFIALTLLK